MHIRRTTDGAVISECEHVIGTESFKPHEAAWLMHALFDHSRMESHAETAALLMRLHNAFAALMNDTDAIILTVEDP